MLTCKKRYDDYPAAHRAAFHDGHCSQIHGHNYSFEIEFASVVPDQNGFIVDFGKLQGLKQKLDYWFDHTLILLRSDPHLDHLTTSLHDFADIRIIRDSSAEGMAEFVYDLAMDALREMKSSAEVISVTCHEDSRNSATFHP